MELFSINHHHDTEGSAEENDRYGEMAQLSQTIIQELEAHTTIEEKIFYPEVKNANEEIAETIAEGIEEHHVVDQLIGEIKGLEASDDTFAAKMKVLIENVEHHATEEEEELFPEVRKVISDSKLTNMAQRLEELKRSLGAPTTADKIDLTKEELDSLARYQVIPGRGSMSKEQLAVTVAPK